MQLKNKSTIKYILAVLVIFVVLAYLKFGGSVDSFIDKEVNPQINVMGMKLLMDEQKADEKVGSKGEKAMCVYGYEYEYPDKLINIGFNSETNQVRRVTSKNPETSIYGIKPGVELAEAYKMLESNGFKRDANVKYNYSKENIIFSIKSMKGTHADGITIEINPDQK